MPNLEVPIGKISYSIEILQAYYGGHVNENRQSAKRI